ncbi:MAG: ferredoxin family protein [Acidobacteriota bacterium]
MKSEVYATGNLVTPNKPIVFDANACTGCNQCIENCVNDVLIPHPERGQPPIVLYPDECWYCGVCERVCPELDEGAIMVKRPMMQRVRWKRKETGEHFRVGMPNPPPPNKRPPA